LRGGERGGEGMKGCIVEDVKWEWDGEFEGKGEL